MINSGKRQVKDKLVFFSRSYVKIKIMADKNNYQNPYILFKEGHIKCRIFFTILKPFCIFKFRNQFVAFNNSEYKKGTFV